jgi:hypothetical protein
LSTSLLRAQARPSPPACEHQEAYNATYYGSSKNRGFARIRPIFSEAWLAMRASSCPQLSIRTRLMSNIADRAATRSCAVAGCRVHAAPSHKVRPADTDTRSSAPRASPAAHELARCARRSANEKEATARPRLLFGFARIRACRKRQWCMNSASNRMIGSGIPISHSSNPRPKPMAFSSAIVDQATNASETRRFHRRLKSSIWIPRLDRRRPHQGLSADVFNLKRGIGELLHVIMTWSHCSHRADPLSRAGDPQITS